MAKHRTFAFVFWQLLHLLAQKHQAISFDFLYQSRPYTEKETTPCHFYSGGFLTSFFQVTHMEVTNNPWKGRLKHPKGSRTEEPENLFLFRFFGCQVPATIGKDGP